MEQSAGIQKNLRSHLFSGVQVLQGHRVLVAEVGRKEPGRVNVFQVGVRWSAEQFAAEASRLEHQCGARAWVAKIL